MSDAEKTIKDVGRSIDKGVRSAGRSFDRAARKAGKRMDEQLDEFGSDLEGYVKNPEKAFQKDTAEAGEKITGTPPAPEEPTIVPIPDENAAELEARRRRARAKTSGRQSTILTEGLGG